MENPRAEKVAVVDEVRAKFTSAAAAVLTEYRGLNVSAISQLRRQLREAGGEYKIYKNTLVRFATRDLGLEIDELLTGPTAITFIEGDAAAVAKALRDYARTNPSLVVKGGLLGMKPLSADQIRALAELPSRDVLLSQLAGAMAAPMQQFAGLLQALPRNLAYGLKALIEDRGGVPEADAPAPEAAAPPEPETAPDAASAPAADAPTADAPVADVPTADAPPADAPATETPPAEADTEAVTADGAAPEAAPEAESAPDPESEPVAEAAAEPEAAADTETVATEDTPEES
jgi:large subunit ribosomal protein L10